MAKGDVISLGGQLFEKYIPYQRAANGIAAGNTLVSVMSINGEGFMRSCVCKHSSTGALTLKIRVTIDGEVVFDIASSTTVGNTNVWGIINPEDLLGTGTQYTDADPTAISPITVAGAIGRFSDTYKVPSSARGAFLPFPLVFKKSVLIEASISSPANLSYEYKGGLLKS